MTHKTIRGLHPSHRDDIADLVTRRPLPGPKVGQVDPFLFLNHHGPQVYPPHNRGLPFGPHAGGPETVEAAGICALLLECYVIMGAAWAWMQDYEPEAVSRFRSALVLLGANGVIAGTVCVGVAASFQNHHEHHAPLEAQRGVPQHHTEAPMPSGQPTAPVAPEPGDAGLPVTDMALHNDQDHQQDHPQS